MYIDDFKLSDGRGLGRAIDDHYYDHTDDMLDLSGLEFEDIDFTELGHALRCIIFDNCLFNNCKFPFIDDCSFVNSKIYCSTFSKLMVNCNFTNAALRENDLRYIDINRCCFIKADCFDSIFFGSTIISCKQPPQIPMACPSDGSFVGWKKVVNNGRIYIIKLQIPASAKRCSATTRKCRAEYVKVLGIYDELKRKMKVTKVTNWKFSHRTIYEVGKITRPDFFDTDRWNECSHGIHFFVDFEDAVNYPI